WTRHRRWRRAHPAAPARPGQRRGANRWRKPRSGPWFLHLEGAATARKRRIGHEISMRRKCVRVLGMGIADIGSIRLHIPALGLVFHLGDQDLVKDLLMDGGVVDGNQGLHA